MRLRHRRKQSTVPSSSHQAPLHVGDYTITRLTPDSKDYGEAIAWLERERSRQDADPHHFDMPERCLKGLRWCQTRRDSEEQRDYHIYAARDKHGDFAGVRVFRHRRTEGKVSSYATYVRPEARNQSLGRKLFGLAVDAARELGATRVTCEVDTENIASQRMVEQAGFTRRRSVHSEDRRFNLYELDLTKPEQLSPP